MAGARNHVTSQLLLLSYLETGPDWGPFALYCMARCWLPIFSGKLQGFLGVRFAQAQMLRVWIM